MHIVIIGSGIAGVSFAEKYRSLSTDAQITLITRENDGYYSRPLLSRGFTKADIEQSIILKTFEKLETDNIRIVSGAEVSAIDRSKQNITFTLGDRETTLDYDRLILALGSSGFVPPPFRPYDDLFFRLNSLVDLKALRKFRQIILSQNRTPEWAIIGGGLIGCELASDLAVAGDQITLYHAMGRLMERQLVTEDSIALLNDLKNLNVKVWLNQDVQRFSSHGKKRCVISNGLSSEFDALIVSCGFKPRTELAEKAGLEVGRGIKVNQQLQTSDAHIYALGDVAELPNGKLYAFILPIRNQALWLAGFLAGQQQTPWEPPAFSPKAKVHGFEALHPYIF